jgi:hypothetical protein
MPVIGVVLIIEDCEGVILLAGGMQCLDMHMI